MSMIQLSTVVMESFGEDDDLALSVPEKSSSPLLKPKLKRLKKAAATSLQLPLANRGVPGAPDVPTSPAAPEPSEIRRGFSDVMGDKGLGEETGSAAELDPLFAYRSAEEMLSDPYGAEVGVSELRGGKDEEEVVVEELEKDVMGDKGFGEETGSAAELDPLFAYRSAEEMLSDPYGAEVGVSEVRGGKDEEEVVVEELEKQKILKRRLSLEDEEEDLNTRRKKKGKSAKLEGLDGKPKESVRERKRLEKERKTELEHLHAETQRLLRETRDASFKPALLIQKPISSVLDKIRLRKLEILKSCSILGSLPSVVDADCPKGSDCSSNPANSQSDIKEIDRNAKVTFDFVGSKGTRQNLTNDTQANKSGSQLSSGCDKLLKSQEASPLSYPPTSSLNIHGGGNDDGVASSSDHDVSSSEEESDKENIGPSVCNVVNKDSSPKAGLAKAFLDDEAEEEDDSDCDLLRFQENEEENETDEHEELDDLIATGYEEASMDQDKRNELHQKWLEQQDAAETDNVLQRLKSGRRGLEKPALIHGDYNNYEESENDDEGNVSDNDGDDEAEYNNHPIDSSRQSLKKGKQMISHMFTDANDVYIPSDDEETEKILFRHRILKHNEEPSFISPVEDETSRDFFGLIKKLNIAPSTKKRGKASAPHFDSLLLPGNSNSSSKSSFLNRASNSIPSSSHKQGSIAVRAFIFSRDDSNSRSNVSTSEINSEMVEKESVSAKNSQRKSSIIKETVQANSESGSSLFNILRNSSIKFDKKLEAKRSVSSITESQAAYQFSAFKLRRTSKTGPRI